MYRYSNKYSCKPPNAFEEILVHPSGKDDSIEKAVIGDHRFAFYYWLKWKKRLIKKKKLSIPSTLISIDFHRDLAAPTEIEKKELTELNIHNLSDVSNFVWARLNLNNDGHILASAYLNLIGDVILLKQQGSDNIFVFKDQFGNNHRVFETTDYELFANEILKLETKCFYLDIDLDYFTNGIEDSGIKKTVTLFSNDKISSILNTKNQLFTHLLPKVEGMTFATEPYYCGGIQNSSHLLRCVDSCFFTKEGEWKHLMEYDN